MAARANISSIWFQAKQVIGMRLIKLEGVLELFQWPNRSVICSVHGWITDQTHSLHSGVIFFIQSIAKYLAIMTAEANNWTLK